jgi:ABC-type transport system substrate-binding protein
MRSIRRSPEPLGLALAVALALACAACSDELPAPIPAAGGEGATPKRGGVLTVATFGDMRALDPANIGDGLGPMVLESIFAGLVDYDHESRIEPDLAERWTVEDEGKTYRFVLRQGVRFQDGEELTADDVKRSAERALHPSSPNPYSSYYSGIVGYEAFTEKKAEHLDGVEVDGRYVVSFHLKAPDATFLPLLALQVLRPVCKSGGDRYSDTWIACGAGPFKLLPGGWERGRQIELVRHDGYFRPGLPLLDGFRVVFHVNQTTQRFKLVRGEQDILRDFLSPDLLHFRADPRWSPFGEYETEKQIGGEALNVEMPPFDNVEIRRAVACAIDRDELALVRASNLRPLGGPIPPGVPGFDPTFVGQVYDYPAALEHMRRAGYPYDPKTKTGGWPKPIPYIVYKASLQEYTAQVVAQQLAKIGIHLDLHLVNYPTFLAIRGRRGQSPAGPGFWQQDYPDAMSFLEPLFSSRSINDEDSNNWSFYKNPRYDELLDRARRELDDETRKRTYREASQILVDDAPWAFEFSYRWYSQRQPYVRDWHPHPIWTHEVSRTWLDRGRGPLAARNFFTRGALAALIGSAPDEAGGERAP